MDEIKKELLLEQVNKIKEIIDTLSNNFTQEYVADEISYLAIVRDNLIDLAKK